MTTNWLGLFLGVCVSMLEGHHVSKSDPNLPGREPDARLGSSCEQVISARTPPGIRPFAQRRTRGRARLSRAAPPAPPAEVEGGDASALRPDNEEGTSELVPTVLTADELAVLLRVNRKTVYDALSRGEIPGARKVGNTYRILREAVIVWLTSANGRVSHSKRKR